VDEVLVVDDGSKDRSAEVARAAGATVHSMGRRVRRGRGPARRLIASAWNAASTSWSSSRATTRTRPRRLPLLLDPIADGRADFVQGSRFLKTSAALRRHAALPAPGDARAPAALLAGRAAGASPSRRTASARCTGACSKTRASTSTQDWLDEYELEPYLYLKTIRLGYRTVEVPVTKIYPPRAARPDEDAARPRLVVDPAAAGADGAGAEALEPGVETARVISTSPREINGRAMATNSTRRRRPADSSRASTSWPASPLSSWPPAVPHRPRSPWEAKP
jgi:dolichol-phosphate mannosyltransferase